MSNDWLPFTDQPCNELSEFLFDARLRTVESGMPLPVTCGDPFNDEVSEKATLEVCFDSFQIQGESAAASRTKASAELPITGISIHSTE
jgi:hypothetical protein